LNRGWKKFKETSENQRWVEVIKREKRVRKEEDERKEDTVQSL
jgi:hypothetical protein